MKKLVVHNLHLPNKSTKQVYIWRFWLYPFFFILFHLLIPQPYCKSWLICWNCLYRWQNVLKQNFMGLRKYNIVSTYSQRNILQRQPFKLHANIDQFTGLHSLLVHLILGVSSCPPRGDYLHSTCAGNIIICIYNCKVSDIYSAD